nr:hypothetical protein [Micromonospora sp. DSM 115978]
MWALYAMFDPRPSDATFLRVAPGERAKWWEDCLSGGFIAVGWDEVGDLGQYGSDTELRDAMDRQWPGQPGGHLTQARQLLAYRDLQPGDRVLANRGLADVLAVGTVTDGGYRYELSRRECRNLVAVDWDTSYAQTLPAPQHGWRTTFSKVSKRLWADLQSRRDDNGRSDRSRVGDHLLPSGASAGRRNIALTASGSAWAADAPDDVTEVAEALMRKGQVILSGPPGTGKTRLALSVALALTGNADAIDAPEHERRAAL